MATYYVRPVNGSDANAGTSFGAAFQTLQKAVDTAASAGDVIRICPESVETITVAIDFDTNAGASGSPITIEPGNTTDGSRDLSLHYTVRTSNAIHMLQFAAAADWYRVWNLICDGNGSATECLSNGVDGSDNHVFIGCRFTAATSHNINVRGVATWVFIDCEADGSGANGINHSGANRGGIVWIAGSIHGNTGWGWDCNRTTCRLANARVYSNGSGGWRGINNSAGAEIVGNTFYGNGGDGVQFYSSAHPVQVYNNTSSSNSGYGFNFNSTANPSWFDHNHTYNNTSGASDITMPGVNNRTGDPLFANPGSADFTPANNSPLDSNGLNGSDIGAIKAADPSGGVVMSGGMRGGFVNG